MCLSVCPSVRAAALPARSGLSQRSLGIGVSSRCSKGFFLGETLHRGDPTALLGCLRPRREVGASFLGTAGEWGSVSVGCLLNERKEQ